MKTWHSDHYVLPHTEDEQQILTLIRLLEPVSYGDLLQYSKQNELELRRTLRRLLFLRVITKVEGKFGLVENVD